MFAQAGIDRKAAAQWLEAIWHDRGCRKIRGEAQPRDQRPDPARDLFRVAPRGLLRLGKVTAPRHGEINWNDLIEYNRLGITDDIWELIGHRIEVSRQQLVKLLPREKAKTGRKGHDRGAIEKYVHELMEYHGDFSSDDKDWDGLPKLLAKLEDKFGAKRSTLYDIVPAMVDAWKKSRNSRT